MAKSLIKTGKESKGGGLKVLPDKGKKSFHELALEGFEQEKHGWLKAARALHGVYVTEEYKALGFSDFKEYTEKSFNLTYREAMYRVSVGEGLATVQDLGLSETLLRDPDISWMKFYHVARLLDGKTTKEQVEKLLAKAKKMSVREVENYVKNVQIERKGGENVRTITLTIKLTSESAQVFEESANDVRRTTGDNTMSDALAWEYALIDWGFNHSSEAEYVAKVKAAMKAKPVKATRAPQKPRVDQGAKKKAKKPPAKKG